MKILANLFNRVKETFHQPDLEPGPGTCDPGAVTGKPAPKTTNAQRATPSGRPPGKQGRNRRKCTVCKHPERLHLDQALMHGATLESLAQAHGLSKTSIFRHKHYLQVRLLQAGAALDKTQQLDRLLCLARLLHRLEVRFEAAAQAGDDQAMCRLNREINRNLKVMDKIEFRFRSLPEAILFHTVISPDWPDQPTALPTDPAIMAAYRRLVVQGLAESCPPPPKTSAPPKEHRRQPRQVVSRLKQAAANVLPPAPLNPELSSEPNSELKKTTGKQPENFPLPKALSLHLADVALSQLADNPDFYSFDDDPLAPEKNYRPQAENSPAAPAPDPCSPVPAPAAPDLPADNQEPTPNHCSADFSPPNNQQLTTNNCFYDSWDPAHQAEPLWTRPFLTPAEVSSLPPTIPADILAIADIHPIFLKPYLDPKAEHLKGTPFREAPPPSEVPRAAEEPKEQPKPEPSRAEIMMDMTRRLSAMIRGEADEPVGPCRRPRRYSRRGHWDDW